MQPKSEIGSLILGIKSPYQWTSSSATLKSTGLSCTELLFHPSMIWYHYSLLYWKYQYIHLFRSFQCWHLSFYNTKKITLINTTTHQKSLLVLGNSQTDRNFPKFWFLLNNSNLTSENTIDFFPLKEQIH